MLLQKQTKEWNDSTSKSIATQAGSKLRFHGPTFNTVAELEAWAAVLIAADRLEDKQGATVAGTPWRFNGTAFEPMGVVTSRAFGAVGDGVTPDHDALIAAANWWKAQPWRELDLLPIGGEYLVNETVDIIFKVADTAYPGRLFSSGGRVKSGITSVAGTGTVEIISSVLHGTGTTFTTTLHEGDSIRVNGNSYVIGLIGNDDTAYLAQNAGSVTEPAGSAYTIWRPSMRLHTERYIQRLVVESLDVYGASSVTDGSCFAISSNYGLGGSISSGMLSNLKGVSIYGSALSISDGVFEMTIRDCDFGGIKNNATVPPLVRIGAKGTSLGNVSSIFIHNLNTKGGRNGLSSGVNDVYLYGGTILEAWEDGAKLLNYAASVFGLHVENNWQKHKNKAITAYAGVVNVPITAFSDAGDGSHVVVYAAGHDNHDGDKVTISSVSTDFDDTYTVTSADRVAGTFEIAETWPGPSGMTTGTFTNDTIEVTLEGHNMESSGEDVNIADVTGAVYDGDYAVLSVPDADTFRIYNANISFSTDPADGVLSIYGKAGLRINATVECSVYNLNCPNSASGQTHGVRMYCGSGNGQVYGGRRGNGALTLAYFQTANNFAAHMHSGQTFTTSSPDDVVFVYGSERLTVPALGKNRDYNGGTSGTITPARDEGEIIDINPNVARAGLGYTIEAPSWATTPQTGDRITFQFRSTQGTGPYPISFNGAAYALCNGSLVLTTETTLAVVTFEYSANSKWQEVRRSVHPFARMGFAAKSSTHSVPAASFTTPVFLTEVEDTDDAWDGSIFTVPATGMWEVSGVFAFTSVTDGNLYVVALGVNGTTVTDLIGRGAAGATGIMGAGGSVRMYLERGDTLQMRVYCGNATTAYNSTTGYCSFSAYKVASA